MCVPCFGGQHYCLKVTIASLRRPRYIVSPIERCPLDSKTVVRIRECPFSVSGGDSLEIEESGLVEGAVFLGVAGENEHLKL